MASTGFALPLKNQIGEIEVNALTVQADVLNGADQCDGVSCPVS